jgi:hypothetical protein
MFIQCVTKFIHGDYQCWRNVLSNQHAIQCLHFASDCCLCIRAEEWTRLLFNENSIDIDLQEMLTKIPYTNNRLVIAKYWKHVIRRLFGLGRSLLHIIRGTSNIRYEQGKLSPICKVQIKIVSFIVTSILNLI